MVVRQQYLFAVKVSRVEILMSVLSRAMMKNMVKVAIKEMAERRGITSCYQLMKALNIPPSLAAKWFNNDLESISIRTLDRLYTALRCKPSDLLRYEPDHGKADD
jgi:DNA-binding Xre family transcriptional regulator